MLLVVKRNNQRVNEYRFEAGPVTIGRQAESNICLPDRVVSKNHAKIFVDEDGQWTVQDLDSANKTYLNDRAVYKAKIKTGDCIRIADYTIEVNLDTSAKSEAPPGEDTLQLHASLATPPHDIVVRKPDALHAPAMRLAAKRLSEFSEATEKITGTDHLDQLLLVLLDITAKQFDALHVWCALRDKPSGPMTCHGGKDRRGKPVQLDDLSLKQKVVQAVERGEFLVLPRVAADIESAHRIRSALIAAIMRPEGCYGVLYVDNAMVHEHYSLSDLDYLMLIAIHTAAHLKHIISLPARSR